MKTHKFARKPFYVDAVRVSEANIAEVAEWCGGSVEKTEDDGQSYVKVQVHRPLNERQSQAFIGDWVLFAGTGYKVYTPKAFDKSFEKVKTLTKAQADEAGIKVPHEPRPKLGAVGLAFKDAEKKAKGPVPTPPKQRQPAPDPSGVQGGFRMDRVEEAIADGEVKVISNAKLESVSIVSSEEALPGTEIEVLPGITASANLAPQFSEIVVSEPKTKEEILQDTLQAFKGEKAEISEEEKQANADAVIAEVLADEPADLS